jgi:hypothetical protein
VVVVDDTLTCMIALLWAKDGLRGTWVGVLSAVDGTVAHPSREILLLLLLAEAVWVRLPLRGMVAEYTAISFKSLLRSVMSSDKAEPITFRSAQSEPVGMDTSMFRPGVGQHIGTTKS